MPIPCGEFKAEVLRRRELSAERTDQTYDQEDRTNDYVGAVKSGRHEKGGAVDVAGIVERGMPVFVGLHAGERQPEHDGANKAPDQAFAIVVEERVVRP